MTFAMMIFTATMFVIARVIENDIKVTAQAAAQAPAPAPANPLLAVTSCNRHFGVRPRSGENNSLDFLEYGGILNVEFNTD